MLKLDLKVRSNSIADVVLCRYLVSVFARGKIMAFCLPKNRSKMKNTTYEKITKCNKNSTENKNISSNHLCNSMFRK